MQMKRPAVCVRKEGTIVGHVPVEYSRIFYFFLLHNGRISCEVIGHQKHGKGLEVSCRYSLTGTEVKLYEKRRPASQSLYESSL